MESASAASDGLAASSAAESGKVLTLLIVNALVTGYMSVPRGMPTLYAGLAYPSLHVSLLIDIIHLSNVHPVLHTTENAKLSFFSTTADNSSNLCDEVCR